MWRRLVPAQRGLRNYRLMAKKRTHPSGDGFFFSLPNQLCQRAESVQQRGGQPDVVIEETMEGFGAAREFDQVSLERLGEGVEEAPDVARLEVVVAGVPPFPQDFRYGPVGNYSDIA